MVKVMEKMVNKIVKDKVVVKDKKMVKVKAEMVENVLIVVKNKMVKVMVKDKVKAKVKNLQKNLVMVQMVNLVKVVRIM